MEICRHKRTILRSCLKITVCIWLSGLAAYTWAQPTSSSTRPRVIPTSDGEIDDECSLVRFLLYTNEWDVEGIMDL